MNLLSNKTINTNNSDVDKSLVTMFLNMSPEERLLMNDRSASTIMELRNAIKQEQADKRKSQLNS